MTQAKKSKYLTKTVKFKGQNLTLYSLDGAVWSSRKDELSQILERHEAERQKLAQLKPEVEEAEKNTEVAEGEEKESGDEESEIVIASSVSDGDDEQPQPKNKAAKRPAAQKVAKVPAKAKKPLPSKKQKEPSKSSKAGNKTKRRAA